MDITQVRVYPIDDAKLRGFASIVFDDCFLVNDLKIIHGKEGAFVSMPSKKKRDGQYKDIAHPLNREMRQKIEEFIFSEYEKVTGQSVQSRAVGITEPDAAEESVPVQDVVEPDVTEQGAAEQDVVKQDITEQSVAEPTITEQEESLPQE